MICSSGFTLHSVSGDRDCLFKSIVYSLLHNMQDILNVEQNYLINRKIEMTGRVEETVTSLRRLMFRECYKIGMNIRDFCVLKPV